MISRKKLGIIISLVCVILAGCATLGRAILKEVLENDSIWEETVRIEEVYCVPTA